MDRDRFSAKAFLDRDTLLHLRIPFSYYLFPVFWFGVSQSAPNIHAIETVIVGIALHFFIYPGSNLYNSYMDEDTGAIGGIEHPPPVTRNMYYVSIFVDVAGILLCSLAGWKHALVMCGYIAFSKAYSWRGIRLKKMPVLGWLSVAFFQGAYTFMMGNMAGTDGVCDCWFTPQHLEAALLASLLIGGSYPLTQVYQHEEDGARGDYTISYKLGVRGTFVFTGIFFTAGAAVALHYFTSYYSLSQFLVFLACLSPVVAYFSWWAMKCFQNPAAATYHRLMRMNRISATCMIVCFGIVLWMNSRL